MGEHVLKHLMIETQLAISHMFRFRCINLSTPKSQHSDDLSWFLEPIKCVVDRNPISAKLGNNCDAESLFAVESTLSLTNDTPSNKRKGSTACDIMHKDYVDVMEKIECNDPEMTQVAKDKFNEMQAEIIKLQISKNKDDSISNGHLNSLINV